MSRERRPPTLRRLFARGHLQLVLFAVLLAAAGLMLSGAFLIRGYARANLDLAARTISYTVEPAVLFGDSDAAKDAAAAVAAMGSVDRLIVRDRAGTVLVDWRREKSGFEDRMVDMANAVVWPQAVRREIAYAGEPIGSVELHGNADALTRFAISGLIIALCCLGLTVLATRLLARRLEEEVVAPIEHLAQVADAVRNDRDFSRRVERSGIVEIDNFGGDFNALLEELQGWHEGMTRENEGLAREVELDPLTGLGNRKRFDRRLAEVVSRALATGQNCALLFVDTDRFKQINDEYGHDAGDAVLVGIAERLRLCLRDHDHVYRIGGDEFTVLLEPEQDLASVEQVVSRIHASFGEPVPIGGGRTVVVTLSVGSALCPGEGATAAELLRRADVDMYRNKRGGTG